MSGRNGLPEECQGAINTEEGGIAAWQPRQPNSSTGLVIEQGHPGKRKGYASQIPHSSWTHLGELIWDMRLIFK